MSSNPIFVTRHPGIVEWLKRQGYQPAQIIDRVDHPAQIAGKTVIGILPMRYSLLPKLFGRACMQPIPAHLRKFNYTAEEMFANGAVIRWYRIDRLTPEQAKELRAKEHALDPTT